MSGYDTALTPEQEKQYGAWTATESQRMGRDITRDVEDYDLRGLWQSQGGFGDNGHAPDTYKKPNHPTFSDQSKYHGIDDNVGGHWDNVGEKDRFTPGPTNNFHFDRNKLQEYFDTREPGVLLNHAAPASSDHDEYTAAWNGPAPIAEKSSAYKNEWVKD